MGLAVSNSLPPLDLFYAHRQTGRLLVQARKIGREARSEVRRVGAPLVFDVVRRLVCHGLAAE